MASKVDAYVLKQRQAVYVHRNIETRSRNHCYSGKAISITYCECVFVALGNQHAMRMYPYCHLWPVWLYSIFPHCLMNGTIFGKKLLDTECVFSLSLQLLLETFLILRRNERDMIKKLYWSSCTVPFILVRL